MNIPTANLTAIKLTPKPESRFGEKKMNRRGVVDWPLGTWKEKESNES